jgi:hypothetical protein
VFIPFDLNRSFSFFENRYDVPQLIGVQIIAPDKLARVHPEFCLSPTALHMDMTRFKTFVAVKEKPEPSLAENVWH